MNWKKEYASAFRSVDVLKERLHLSSAEEEYFNEQSDGFLFAIPEYYFSLFGESEDDPLRRQAVPRIDELTVKSSECTDPLGEESYKVTSRLIHRYRDRALFLTTDSCGMYCRHCFRRNFTGHHRGPAGEEETAAAAEYVAAHPEITEVIFSGGDPLVLDTVTLHRYLSLFQSVRKDILFRIGTRMPVVMPSRIDSSLIDMLTAFKPVFIMTQFNHPRECTPESLRSTEMFIDAGIPVFNQAVLLKNINDSTDILEELFHTLVRNRIKPYYLFQGDLAPGTSHFRTSLGKGLQLMKELRSRISGLSLPVYAVDLPCGGGKVPLTEQYVMGKTAKGWNLTDSSGNIFVYPDE